MQLFIKTDLNDDPDWSDPAEDQPPADRQHELRATSLLTITCRDAAGVEVDGALDVEVLMLDPGAGDRPSWTNIGNRTGHPTGANGVGLKLDVGGVVVVAVRLSNINAEGSTTVEVKAQPWRPS